MITGFNHVGIVVKDASALAALMSEQLGAVEVERQIFEKENQLSILVAVGSGKVEIMSPLRPGGGGTVDQYLTKFGGGMHHISLRAEDFDQDVTDLEAKGVNVFGNTEINGQKIAFAHPKSTGGILYEILEPPKK